MQLFHSLLFPGKAFGSSYVSSLGLDFIFSFALKV